MVLKTSEEKLKDEMKIACAKFLKEKRQEAGLTQGQVRLELNYTTAQFVSNWERGLTLAPIKTVVSDLAGLYGFNPDEYIELVLDYQRRIYRNLIS